MYVYVYAVASVAVSRIYVHLCVSFADEAYITHVDVHGVYKRPSDKRFIYIIQVQCMVRWEGCVRAYGCRCVHTNWRRGKKATFPDKSKKDQYIFCNSL